MTLLQGLYYEMLWFAAATAVTIAWFTLAIWVSDGCCRRWLNTLKRLLSWFR